jgi:Tfp pilus assembly protein PilX
VSALSVRVRDERGIALVMALLVMMVLTISLTTVLFMTSSGSRDASRVNAGQKAYEMAEAGLNNGIAVLFSHYPESTVYPGDASWMPAQSSTFADGTAYWCGTLDVNLLEWNVTAYGVVANPTGPSAATTRRLCGASYSGNAGDILRKVTAVVPVFVDQTPGGASLVWQWLYAPLDASLQNSGTLAAPLFVGRDLTIQNSLAVSNRLYVTRNLTFQGQGHMDAVSPPLAAGTSQLSVGGYVRLENNNGYVGASGAPIVQADLIGACVAKGLTGYNNTRPSRRPTSLVPAQTAESLSPQAGRTTPPCPRRRSAPRS